MCVMLSNIRAMLIYTDMLILLISLLLIYKPRSTNAKKIYLPKDRNLFLV